MSAPRRGALLCTPSVLTDCPATANVLDLIYGNALIHLALLTAVPFRCGDDEGSGAEYAPRVQEEFDEEVVRAAYDLQGGQDPATLGT